MIKDLYYICKYLNLHGKLEIDPKFGSVELVLYKFTGLQYKEYLYMNNEYHIKDPSYFYIKFKYDLKEDLYRALAWREAKISQINLNWFTKIVHSYKVY